LKCLKLVIFCLLMPYNFVGLNNIFRISFYETYNNKIKHYKWKSSSHIHMHINVYIQCKHMHMVKHMNIYDIVSYIFNIQMCRCIHIMIYTHEHKSYHMTYFKPIIIQINVYMHHDIMCIWSYKNMCIISFRHSH